MLVLTVRPGDAFEVDGKIVCFTKNPNDKFGRGYRMVFLGDKDAIIESDCA